MRILQTLRQRRDQYWEYAVQERQLFRWRRPVGNVEVVE